MGLIKSLVNEKNGFKEIELIYNFSFTTPFTVDDNTLTNTLKIRRHKVMLRDYDRIKAMYPRHVEESKIKTRAI